MPACTPRRPTGRSVADLDLAAQWDDPDYGPDEVSPGSRFEARWRCPEGDDHVWRAQVRSRTRKKAAGCPFCAGLRPCAGHNLQDVHPDVAAEWHPTKNGQLAPTQVTPGSNQLVWWQCDAGEDHVWQARVAQRTKAARPTGCPACAGKLVVESNSLAANEPDVAAEWHPTANGNLTPDDVTCGSAKEIVWQCVKEPTHTWSAPIKERVWGNKRCPKCHPTSATGGGGRRSVPTEQSLLSRSPQLAAEWHPSRNERSPEEVLATSNDRVWWQCPAANDHQWDAIVNDRFQSTTGCPFCAGRRLAADTSLAAVAPELAEQWDEEANGKTAEEVLAGSTTPAMWKCDAGHQWEAPPTVRRYQNTRCPYCQGVETSPETSVAGRFPHLLDWHNPEDADAPDLWKVGVSCRQVTRWQCPRNSEHNWHATVFTVASGGTCPLCRLAGRSLVQIRVAFELAEFLPVDPTSSARVGGWPRDVDMADPTRQVTIEYDGAWWHKDQQDHDLRKTAAIEAAGWQMLRIRELPLPRLGEHDVLVEPGDVHAAAAGVLDAYAARGWLDPDVAATYRKAGELAATGRAEDHINQLLDIQYGEDAG